MQRYYKNKIGGLENEKTKYTSQLSEAKQQLDFLEKSIQSGGQPPQEKKTFNNKDKVKQVNIEELTDRLTAEIKKVYRVVDEQTSLESRDQVDLLQEIERSMLEYRALIIKVYAPGDDQDKGGPQKHEEFIRAVKVEDKNRKDERNEEFKADARKKDAERAQEQQKQADYRKNKVAPFLAKKLAAPAQKKEMKKVVVEKK